MTELFRNPGRAKRFEAIKALDVARGVLPHATELADKNRGGF